MTRLLSQKQRLQPQLRIFSQAAIHSAAREKTCPDRWGAENRVYPPTSGKPGPRDPALTPYVIPFERGFADRRYRRNVMVTAAQSGKSDSLLDVIGERLDTRPVPIIYV